MPPDSSEERVIIIAPVGQDATAMAAVLNQNGFQPEICSGLLEFCERLTAGAGALLLTDEALELPALPNLLEWLESQPPWSELPVVILTKAGESRVPRLLDLTAAAAGSLTLLERPIGSTTLLRSVEVALHSRRRQYQVRDLLEAQQRQQQALADAHARLENHATNLERTVAERTRDLRATNEQLEAFVYSMAHDLRAPLRTITGYSQLLLDDHSTGLSPSGQHLLKRVQASSEFMDKLLMDLLAFGRTARAEIELSPVRVRDAWENALFQCAIQIEQTHAQIETNESRLTVHAHEVTLSQCLANILSNALKFVAPGVRPAVRFWSESTGGYARLCLEDNGLGIPVDQQERVFRVFERLHGSRYHGTGIGLSIVRKGVERMGGKVGLESEPGRGTRFWIDLPQANSPGT
jgi:signal transduction histidine kinase